MSLQLKIGPAVIEIQADRPPQDGFRPNHTPFISIDKERPSLTLRVRSDPPPPRGHATLIAECVTHWQLYAQQEGYRLEALEQMRFRTKQVALINRALDKVDVHVLSLPRSLEVPHTDWFLAELLSPFLQWWWTAWAALRKEGMILHGSAVAFEDHGLACVGPSGSGKTTIARWCRDEAQATVLNDERILVWSRDGRWKVGGTPWHGELREVSPISVPLVRLCFLRKASTNQLVSLSAVQGLAHLISEAFLPIWSQESMQGLLEVGDRLVKEVPSGELQFVNGPSIIDYLRELMNLPRDAAAVGMR